MHVSRSSSHVRSQRLNLHSGKLNTILLMTPYSRCYSITNYAIHKGFCHARVCYPETRKCNSCFFANIEWSEHMVQKDFF